LFTKERCTYNTHAFFAHADFLREKGPLTECSAFPFEGHFGELRFLVVPGTQSIGKQLIEGLYLRVLRDVRAHYCFKKGRTTMRETDRGTYNTISIEFALPNLPFFFIPTVDDTLFYMYSQQQKYRFFKCVEISDDGTL
jgi:hypothetical protein